MRQCGNAATRQWAAIRECGKAGMRQWAGPTFRIRCRVAESAHHRISAIATLPHCRVAALRLLLTVSPERIEAAPRGITPKAPSENPDAQQQVGPGASCELRDCGRGGVPD